MCFLLVLFGVSILVFFLLLFFNVLNISFVSLGLNDVTAFILMLAILLGSMFNIPITRRQLPFYEKNLPGYHNFFYYYPPKVNHQTIAINIGGALIPFIFAIYLFFVAGTPIWQSLVGALIIAVICRFITTPVYGVGFKMIWILPPLLAGLWALLVGDSNPAPIAFISGVLGTLIGVYGLNFNRYDKVGPAVINIGGGGIFGGIFLTGVVAVLLAGIGS